MTNFLGVGILYNPVVEGFLKEYPNAVDYVEIIPDTLMIDNGVGKKNRFEIQPAFFKKIKDLGARYPLVAHHVGFSLGSAEFFDFEYLENVVKLQNEFNFLWNSDHLSYSKVHDESVGEYNTCLAIPVPYDRSVLNMLSDKINMIRGKINTPFAIENNVYFVEIENQEYLEGDFLKELYQSSGCGLLLDLHNVHANAVNFKFDEKLFVDSLDLDSVTEFHIAGGNEVAGMYMDSHSGPCNEEVWDLLEYTFPRCKNLRGITYEFHESYFHLMNNVGIAEQLNRAKEISRKSLAGGSPVTP
jgi:uncharacterized protein (UPF0276 family)